MSDLAFNELFEAQMRNQMLMLSRGMYDNKERKIILPIDDVNLSSYHVQQLISEVGEVLEADKRWKNFRKDKYNKAGKLEEIADCFIVLMNIAMFSGFDSKELYNAIYEKIQLVEKRVNENK